MLSLDTLISNEKVRGDFRSIINEANGIIIVSGPTGSGKSTTLASALREKDSGELNIVTAEDPIEYDLGEYSAVSCHKSKRTDVRKSFTYLSSSGP